MLWTSFRNQMLDKNIYRRMRFVCAPVALLLFGLSRSGSLAAQAVESLGGRAGGDLQLLLARADSLNPSIRAARSRIAAARARVGPAGAWDDPTLMAGILNLPLGSMKNENPSLDGTAMRPLPGDDMTMKMIGVEQSIPYPGRLALRRQVAVREIAGATAALESTRRGIDRDIRKMVFELVYLDDALAEVERNQVVLVDIIRVTEARYSSGLSGQQNVLKARVEASRSGESASTLIEQRRAVIAELNSLVDRESTAPLDRARIPDRITSAAIPTDPARIRFASQSLGSRLADSPILPLAELQELAVRNNADLKEAESRVAVQSAILGLARNAYKPDITLSLQYGQRNQRPDMVSAVVSVAVPVHRRSRQNNQVIEARSDLAALESEYRAQSNKVRAEVARLVGEAERNRTQLALYRKAILPQGEAAIMSSLAAYRAGVGELLGVMDNQNTVFAYRLAFHRSMTDFAKAVADLEAVVGSEVLR